MRGMNSDCVDLIYLDPPFNSNRDYAAPIGSKAAGAAFKDTWTPSDTKDVWHSEIAKNYPALYTNIDAARLTHSEGMKAYLIMMAVRLLEMRRLLKPTGSIYLHCDPTASHYIKTLMDCIFGRDNFRNEIIWHKGYRGTPRKRRYQQEHDTIFFYSAEGKYIWNNTFGEYKDKSLSRYNKFDKNGNRYALIKRRRADGSVYYGRTYPKGKLQGDVISIPLLASTDEERTGFPTQKPLTLIDLIIRASSNEGDTVFDPFCGCATALVAADRLKREWIGIDLSQMAVKLVLSRIRKERGELFDKIIHREDIPSRTDLGKLAPYRTNKENLFGKQQGLCNGCREHIQYRNLQVDHIVPQSKGGSDHIENLQLLCGACNLAKGSGTHEALIAKLKKEGIRR